ncbi:hypothetical protein BDF22DRAFT_740611 [Syncephalis plumigaleata]|nr:hypothetical protein BDF22DRAFT_740611 [Syncephalis plumigaleata]
MRIRLELVAPLPVIRCWFEVPTHGSRGQEILSIAQLERYIKQELNIHVNQALQLELEGFNCCPTVELTDYYVIMTFISLDESNTVVNISTLTSSNLLTPKNKTRKRKAPSDTESSSDSDSSDSSSSSSSSDESKHKRTRVSSTKEVQSSESDSADTSSEDSSSDSSSSSDDEPTKLPIARTESQTKSEIDAAAFVPPGKGSRATKSRNLRRKLARQRHQLGTEVTGNTPSQQQPVSHSVKEEQANTRHSEASVEQTVVQPVKQNALPVKNKPKHFAKAMQGAVRTHMRFDASKANKTVNDDKQTTKEDAVASPSRLVDWWTYRTEPVLENNFTTIIDDSAISDKSPVNKPERPRVDTATPVKSNDVKRDYESAPALTSLPEPGQLLAFKQLEMSEAYTPEISAYKEAIVLAYDAISDKVTLQLTANSMDTLPGTSNSNRNGDNDNMDDEYDEEDKPRRRFEMDLGDNSEYVIEGQVNDSVLVIDRNTMLETKCLSV